MKKGLGLRRRCAMPFRALAMIALLQASSPDHVPTVLSCFSLTRNVPALPPGTSDCYITMVSALFVERCLLLTSPGSHMRFFHGGPKRNGLRYY